MNLKEQRQSRLYQANHRGSNRSYRTEMENLQLLLAWEAEQLSEGQLSRILGIDRIAVRQKRLDALEAGLVLAESLSPAPGG